MSLLLEALKKAEKAKEDAQRRAEAGEPDPEATIAPGRPVMTKDQLPEIPSQPLEIVSDELQLAPEPAPVPRPAAPAEPSPPPRPTRARPVQSEEPAPDAQSAQRSAARKVFEVKFREPNPRMPFYITTGALGVFALGTAIYFYIQLRPPPPLVNVNPPRQAEEATAAATSAAPRPTAAAQATSTIAGLPTGVAPASSAPASSAVTPTAPMAAAPLVPPVPRESGPAVPVSRSPQAEPRRIRPTPPPAGAAAQASAAPAAATPSGRAAPQVHPRVEGGFAAYQAGDFAAARREYDQALADDPGNRDALLGSAALDVRAGRFESAEATYLRLLQIDPRDPHAHAALVSLRAGRLDPLAAEGRVKTLLSVDPSAHVLNFALGNQFAQQGRWREAQTEYFKAASAEPDNADFAYNLAVSLDQLRQPRLALEYYQRAIALAEKRGAASFDLAAARARAMQLAKAPSP